MFARAIPAVLGLTMLAGCTVGPDFFAPAPPPVEGYLPGRADKTAGVATVRGADVSERWWKVFRSRALNRLIQDGIDNNQDLAAAEAAVRAAQANALSLRATLFPVLSASFDASRQMTPSQTLQTNAASGADTYSLHTDRKSVV